MSTHTHTHIEQSAASAYTITSHYATLYYSYNDFFKAEGSR